MSRIGLVTNFLSRGLLADTQIVKQAAPEHDYVDLQWDKPSDIKTDLNIHFEVIGTRLIANAKQNWLIPNLEFLSNEILSIVRLSAIDKTLAKTRDAQVLLSSQGIPSLEYIGFASQDYYNPAIEKKECFLHLAGKSQHRNTQAILDAWKTYQLPYKLIVVSVYFEENIPNVTFLKEVDDAEMIRLMNSCKYHLLPSEYEGWGHALHQAMLVGAQILTQDGPSTKGLGQFLVPTISSKAMGQIRLQRCDPSDVAQMVEVMVRNPMPSLRDKVLQSNKEFKENMACLLSKLA